ncbi:MAG: hypothetical protein R3A52_24950 [Polyangiales bacterium]
MRAWATTAEAKPKYVVSSTREDFPWTNSHRTTRRPARERAAAQGRDPAGVLLGSGALATGLDRLDLIDEYRFLDAPEDRR